MGDWGVFFWGHDGWRFFRSVGSILFNEFIGGGWRVRNNWWMERGVVG
jgi:hypothetical protein